MNQQQQFETQQALRAQRVTPEEMRAVVALWSRERSEREGVDALPSVADVAEGLDVSPAEAVRLLEQVRAQRAEEQQRAALEAARERLDNSTRLAEAEARRAEAEARHAEAQAPRGQAEQIRQLQELRASGVLNEEEFARAKERVLTVPEPGGAEVAALRGELQRLQLQNELERLDREWLIERERYATHGKHGTSYPEGELADAGTIVMGLLAIGFLIFWISMARSHEAPSFFLLFGVVGIGGVIAATASALSKAGGYRRARDEYQHRRDELLARLRKRSE